MDKDSRAILQRFFISRGMSPGTRKTYMKSFRLLLEFACKELLSITTEDLLTFREEREKYASRTTINKDFSAYSSFFKWAVRAGLLDVNPMSSIDFYKIPETERMKTTYITHEEALRLIRAPLSPGIPPPSRFRIRDHAILATLYFAGLRVSELCKLDWSDINFEDKEILVRESKGSKTRIVVVPQQCIESLKRHKESWGESVAVFEGKRGRLTPKGVSRVVAKYVSKLGLKAHGSSTRITPHVLRHSYATYLTLKGVPEQTLAELMGNPTAVKRYAHVVDDAKRNAARFFET